MELFQNFLLAFVFSFVGSIPPGTLNLTIIQLGFEGKLKIAIRFAVAAALVEYPYAWLAIIFEDFITSSTAILQNFKLISAIVMITLGALNLRAALKPAAVVTIFGDSGFRRGIILSILNPLALPFWIAITAYLKVQGWITLSSPAYLHSYLIGISLGAFALLISAAYLSRKAVSFFGSGGKLKFVPGIMLLALGLYALIESFL